MSTIPRWPLLSLFVFATACPAVPPPTAEPIPTRQETEAEFALSAGDTFEVRVYGEQEMNGTYKVSPDGSIDFPLIGQLIVEDMLPQKVAHLIEEKLGKDYIRNPHVSVLVKEQPSKYVTILGMVVHPGRLQYTPHMKMSDAVAGAGGFTPIANKNSVTITRDTVGDHEHKTVLPVRAGDIQEGRALDIKLHPGDLISVPERLL